MPRIASTIVQPATFEERELEPEHRALRRAFGAAVAGMPVLVVLRNRPGDGRTTLEQRVEPLLRAIHLCAEQPVALTVLDTSDVLSLDGAHLVAISDAVLETQAAVVWYWSTYLLDDVAVVGAIMDGLDPVTGVLVRSSALGGTWYEETEQAMIDLQRALDCFGESHIATAPTWPDALAPDLVS